MINEPVPERNYRMPDAELSMLSVNLLGLIERDAAEFIQHGVSMVEISDFEVLCNAFKLFPSDDMLLADIMLATEERDKLRDRVFISARKISSRAKFKWGVDSTQYLKFNVSGMSNLNVRELLIQARRVHLIGTEFLAELASEGLTISILNDFAALNIEFEAAINMQLNNINEREAKARERISLGNGVYGLIMKYCGIGRQIWRDVNEAKYNDYITYYGKVSYFPGKIKAISYNVLGNKLNWKALPTAITYEVDISPNGKTWESIYNGSAAEVLISKPQGKWFARCRGINNKGKGKWSNAFEFVIPEPS